jgi:hypothetical protein
LDANTTDVPPAGDTAEPINADGADDPTGDIEEALAELFEVDALLSPITSTAAIADAYPAIQSALAKVRRATHLLDRPWP